MDKKSPDAFRTISEVADWLGVPTHVLRFWESRFTQVKPVKRAGGRRYYRPADMELLGGIRKLLHEDGMTIRGVQKLLREQGVKHVAAMSPPLETLDKQDSDGSNVVPLAPARAKSDDTADPAPDAVEPEDVEDDSRNIAEASPDSAEPAQDTHPTEPDSPPTLTDAADAAPQEISASDAGLPVSDTPNQPASRDLFTATDAAAPEEVEQTQTQAQPTSPEHPHEPTELEADVAEASVSDQIEAPVGDAPLPEETSAQHDPVPEPVPESVSDAAPQADSAPEISDPAYIAPPPPPIDVSHIAADVADDTFAPSQNASTCAQLRALRLSGRALPDYVLHSLTARLSDLAARMTPAPSDNGQAE